MRLRTVALAFLLALVASLLGPAFGAAWASGGPGVILAQEPETEGQDTEDTAEETGAGEGETGSASEETGPPWTYQMARLAFVLLVVLALGIGFWYWRLIARRQRSGV